MEQARLRSVNNRWVKCNKRSGAMLFTPHQTERSKDTFPTRQRTSFTYHYLRMQCYIQVALHFPVVFHSLLRKFQAYSSVYIVLKSVSRFVNILKTCTRA